MPIISFDFDGVLHKSVIGIHPINFDKPNTWEPFKEIHTLIKELSKDNEIVILTMRNEWMRTWMHEFINMYDLPISRIYTCEEFDFLPKRDILEKIGATEHYDDNPEMITEMRGSKVKFYLVNKDKIPVYTEYFTIN